MMASECVLKPVFMIIDWLVDVPGCPVVDLLCDQFAGPLAGLGAVCSCSHFWVTDGTSQSS